MINHKINDLNSLIKLLEPIDSKQDHVILLKSIKGDLEEIKTLREEIKSLRVQLEVCKSENEGLRLAYENKIRKELGYE